MSREVDRPDPAELIAVGIVRRPHGVRGEASTESLTSSLERFSELKRVFLVSPDRSRVEPMTVKSSRPHGDRALLQFDSITSPEALREFQNWTVEIPEKEARQLEDDEYFIHDLMGTTLVDREGNVIGRVTDIHEGGGGLLLDVERPSGAHCDIPFAAALCPEIDVQAKRIVVDLPDGLLDLEALPAVEDETEKEIAKPTDSEAVKP